MEAGTSNQIGIGRIYQLAQHLDVSVADLLPPHAFFKPKESTDRLANAFRSDAKEIGLHIALRRFEARLTVTELGKLVGMSAGDIQAIEAGETLPHMKIILQIARALKIRWPKLLQL